MQEQSPTFAIPSFATPASLSPTERCSCRSTFWSSKNSFTVASRLDFRHTLLPNELTEWATVKRRGAAIRVTG
jgi:hypothetical protein